MASNKTNEVLGAIKDEFLGYMTEGQMFTALTTAVPKLEDLGMSQHEACITATRWAIEGGFFDPESEAEMEESAERIENEQRV